MVADEEFERISKQIRASGPASDGDDLLGMEIDCAAFLRQPVMAGGDAKLWRDMKVQRSEGAEWLISGRAVGGVEDLPRIALALSQIWEDHLRYRYRSAYTVLTDESIVALRAISQMGPRSTWVTVDIQVALR